MALLFWWNVMSQHSQNDIPSKYNTYPEEVKVDPGDLRPSLPHSLHLHV